MSELAERERTKRQHWAAPGGQHDKLVRLMRVALPAIIGVLLAVLAFSPFNKTDELSFVLAKEDVDMAKERMRLSKALYRGEDNQGRPFSLSAGSAVQKSSTEPFLRMTDMLGRLLMNEGPAVLIAQRGVYDLQKETMRVEGPLAYTAADGYSMVANNVEFSLKDKTMQSFGPVSGSAKVGNFRANRMTADMDTRIVRLEGGVHLRIDQNAVK